MPMVENWEIDLVDDDLEVPGWRFLPAGLDPTEQQQWVATSVAELEGTAGWDQEVVTAEQAQTLLLEAMDQRAQSDSLAMFQVWPPYLGQTATCHVNILPSEAMPDWTETDKAVVHPTDAPHLGAGIQVVTTRTVTIAELDDVEVTGVHFIFDNEEITFMVSLDETLSPLAGLVFPGLVAVVHNLRLVDTTTRRLFEGVAPPGLLVEGPWDFEASR